MSGLPNERFALLQHFCNDCGSDWLSYCVDWAATRNTLLAICLNGLDREKKFNVDLSQACGSNNVDSKIVGYSDSPDEAHWFLKWSVPVVLG